MFVWLAMVTGARRGELCALRWDALDPGTGVLTIRTSIAQRGGRTWEKETKTHQQRRITLDEATLALLRAYLQQCGEQADALGSGCRSSPGCSRPTRREHLAQAGLGDPAVPPDVRTARLGHAPPPAAPLLGDRADHRRGRRAHGRRPARPRRRRDHHAADLLGVAVRG